MKLSELLASDPLIRDELPAALERARTSITMDEYRERIRALRYPEHEEIVIFEDVPGKEKLDFHKNVIAYDAMLFYARRRLPVVSMLYGIEQNENNETIRDMQIWTAGYTGHYPIDVESIAASQVVIRGFMDLGNKGLIQVTYVNEALL